MSQGRSPRIEKYLSIISEDGCENLFSNLLEIDISFRRGQGEPPTSAEYLKRFPQYTRLVRRAFFEPTIDPDSATDDGGATVSRGGQANDQTLAPTFEIPDNNQLGDYQLLGKLGQGGMGVVYEARHTKTGNRVALKTLPTSLDGQQVDANKLYRFRKEFRSLSNVNHPNLVGMQTLEVEGNQWFFTMDLIEGEDFISYVRPNDQLDEQRLRDCLPQLAKGIIALHQRGIVHRDLKPGNVMVTDQGDVRILDFGLVAELQQNVEATQTRSAMFVGTIPYAAPEQMFGQRTEANDWYGFGTMVYEALVGEVPFPGNNQANLLRKQQEDPPTLEDQGDVPSDLAQLVDGLLRREVVARLGAESVAEFLHLDDDTRIQGSTQGSTQGSKGSLGSNGSRGSSGSVDEENVDLDTFPEEEIVLIGREKQLAQLEEIKQEFLQTKQPSVVWVTGLSGEGKSSLVEKFLQPIRKDKEMLVLSGRCYDRESIPFKAIDSVLDPLASFLRSCSPDFYERAISSNTELLSRIFPILRRVEAIAKSPPPDTREMKARQLQLRGFDALKDLWNEIGKRISIVLLIDDLQWADADSAEMLWEMLSGHNAPPVMLIGSYRRDEADRSSFLKQWRRAKVKVSTASIGRSIPSREIQVEPLTKDQCLKLLAYQTGFSQDSLPAALRRLTEESGGNPYILEVLIENQQAGDGYQVTDLSGVIQRRLSKLPKEATALLEAIAIAGQSAVIDEVAVAANLEQPSLGTLTHMRNEKLVRLIESDEEVRVDTWHDKVRETILGQIKSDYRQKLHLRLAEYLEKQELVQRTDQAVDPERDTVHPRVYDLAYHFSEADDPRAFAYQLAAGKQALSAYAIDESLEYLTQARERLPTNSEDSVKYELFSAIGEAKLGNGEIKNSRELFYRAIRFAQSPLQRVRCLKGIGQGWMRQGELINANDQFQEAVRILGHSEPQSALGRITSILASLTRLLIVPRWKWLNFRKKKSEKFDEAQSVYAEISREFNYALTTDFIAWACFNLGLGAKAKCSEDLEEQLIGYAICAEFIGFNGLIWLSKKILNRVESKIEQCTNKVLLAELKHTLGSAKYYQGLLDDSKRILLNSLPELEKRRSHIEGYTTHYLRHINSIRGHSARVLHWAHKELESGLKTEDNVVTAYALYGMADGLGRSGEFEKAIDSASESGQRLRRSKSLACIIADQELGRAFLQASRYDEAVAVTKAGRDELIRNFAFVELMLDTYAILVEAMLGPNWFTAASVAGNKIKDTRNFARKTRFHCLKFPTLKAHSLRVSGRTESSLGRKQKAMQYFNKAIAAATKIGAEHEHARALIDKSMLEYVESKLDREKGLALLESLGCVLPDAEVEYLGIDRECHHFRAKEAREAEAKRMAEEAK